MELPSFLFPLTHIFPYLLESQGILTNSEDSLETCSKRRIVLRSGFLLKPLTLSHRPLRDRIQTPFVIGSNPLFPKDPLRRVVPIPSTRPVIGPNVMKPWVTSPLCIQPTLPNGPWASCWALPQQSVWFIKPSSPTIYIRRTIISITK